MTILSIFLVYTGSTNKMLNFPHYKHHFLSKKLINFFFVSLYFLGKDINYLQIKGKQQNELVW